MTTHNKRARMGVAAATALLSLASLFALTASPASAAPVPPDKPLSITPTLTDAGSSITVDWTAAPTGEPATGFTINFIPAPVVYDIYGVAVGLIQVPATSKPFVWKGGTPGKSYQVNIVATNAYGASPERTGIVVGPIVAPVVPCTPAGSPACTPPGVNPERPFPAGDWTSVIKRDYWDFAGRKPHLDEMTFWRYFITHNTAANPDGSNNTIDPLTKAGLEANRQIFVAWLAENAEQLDGPTFRLYTAYFARTPDFGGFQYWSNAMNKGKTLVDISNYFATSSEFKTTYGSVDDADFVAIIYANVLNRKPDGSGFSFWTRQLQIGRYSRAQVMIGFSESQEYKNRMVVQVGTGLAYAHMLHRMPTNGEYFIGGVTGCTGYSFPVNPNPDAPVFSCFGNLYYRVVDSTEYRSRGGEPYAAGGWLDLAAANNPPYT